MREEPGDAVEQGRLAGAVLADEPEDLAAVQVEVDVVDGGDAAEALHDAAAREHDRHVGAGGDRLGWPRLGRRCAVPLRRRPRRRRGGRLGALDEHRAQDVGPVEQLGGRAGEAELALLHEHRPLGEVEGDVDRLLDDDDRDAGGVHLVHDLDELADDGRRQAERELVDEQQLRVGDERLADGEHLLLAAGEVAGELVDALGEAREQLEHPLLGRGDRGAGRLRLVQQARRRLSRTVSDGNVLRPPGMSTTPRCGDAGASGRR